MYVQIFIRYYMLFFRGRGSVSCMDNYFLCFFVVEEEDSSPALGAG